MKFNELFTSADNGIFSVFEDVYQNEFEELFGGQSATDLNSVALALYGNKELFGYLSSDNWELFVKTCIGLNLYGWMRTNDALTAEYDVLKSHKRTRKKTGTQGNETDDENTTLSANKPFNEETFKDSERELQTKSRTQTDTFNITETDEDSGNGYMADIIAKEIELRKQSFQREIMLTIVNDITLSLY